MRLEEAVELLPDEGGPDLLVMELATGGERTIDGIANGREIVLGPSEDARGDARRARDVLRDARGRGADGASRNLIVAELGIEHFFNIQLVGELRDRDQPADLDGRLPGGPEPAVPGREARARRDLGRRAARATPPASARAEPRCATSTSSSSTREPVRTRPTGRAASHGHERPRRSRRAKPVAPRRTHPQLPRGHGSGQVGSVDGSSSCGLCPARDAPTPLPGQTKIDESVTVRSTGLCGSRTAPSTSPGSPGRTCRRCGGRASTRGSSSSSAASCTTRPTGRSTATAPLPHGSRRSSPRSRGSHRRPTSSTSTSG